MNYKNKDIKEERIKIKNVKPVLWGATDKAKMYKIEGIKIWIPSSVSEYNEKTEILSVQKWFYEKHMKHKLSKK